MSTQEKGVVVLNNCLPSPLFSFTGNLTALLLWALWHRRREEGKQLGRVYLQLLLARFGQPVSQSWTLISGRTLKHYLDLLTGCLNLLWSNGQWSSVNPGDWIPPAMHLLCGLGWVIFSQLQLLLGEARTIVTYFEGFLPGQKVIKQFASVHLNTAHVLSEVNLTEFNAVHCRHFCEFLVSEQIRSQRAAFPHGQPSGGHMQEFIWWQLQIF